MARLARLKTLTFAECRMVLLAGALQIAARAALRVVDLPRLVAVASWLRPRAPRRAGVSLPTLVWALQASAARVGGTCLTEALAARVLAGWTARPSALVIGVRPGDGAPEFHAWTEIDGMPLPAPAAPLPFARLIVWS